MRDFHVDNIHGNITINSKSENTKYKLLIHCNNEELLLEESHRRKLLRDERSQKNKIIWKFLFISAMLLTIAAIWFYFQHQMNTVTLLLGIAGILIGTVALQQADRQTPFEQRQNAILNEIHTLLRERGIR